MSLTTAVRSLRRTYLKKFPGASDADLGTFLGFAFEAALANTKSTYKDEDAVAYAEEKLAEAAEAYEEWAVNLRDAVLLNTVKPIVDNAEDKGVDPVDALRLEGFSPEQARSYVAALADRADTTVASAVDTDEGEDEGDDASADADGADSATSVSYGYGSPVASA